MARTLTIAAKRTQRLAGRAVALAILPFLACTTDVPPARSLPGEWNLRLVECRTSESGDVIILVEIEGPDRIEAWGLRPSDIGRAETEVRSGVEGEALEWRFGPPKPEGWFESIRVAESGRLRDEGSLILSMSELLVDAGFPVTLKAEAIENLEGQHGELPFGTVVISSVEANRGAIQMVVSQPRFFVGDAGFIGFAFAELTLGSATVQATGASQRLNGNRIERTAVFYLSEGLDPTQRAGLELDVWTFHPRSLELRIPARKCRG